MVLTISVNFLFQCVFEGEKNLFRGSKVKKWVTLVELMINTDRENVINSLYLLGVIPLSSSDCPVK